jgi:hypothetical protein
MGKTHSEITDSIKEWVDHQQMFFVASAPLSGEGHINCSPKGIDSLRIIGPNEVVYQDLTGSGIETIAHVQENSRILIMLCSFTGPPQIVRFHGIGSVHKVGTQGFNEFGQFFNHRIDCRAYISVEVTRVSTSCGYSVPLYEYVGQRDVLDKWAEKKGPDGLVEYRKFKNSLSIDGLPGF